MIFFRSARAAFTGKDFDNDPERILKKEKHSKQTVFHADFKSAVKTFI